jgi:hypothetical protein
MPRTARTPPSARTRSAARHPATVGTGTFLRRKSVGILMVENIPPEVPNVGLVDCAFAPFSVEELSWGSP